MTQRIRDDFSMVDWNLVTLMGKTLPPRDPDEDDNEADEESDTEPDEREPAVVREPDEDE